MVDRGKASKVIGDRPWETPGARGFARLAVYTPSLITNDKPDIDLEELTRVGDKVLSRTDYSSQLL